MDWNLIVPWILLIIVILILFVPNQIKRNILVWLLGLQLLLCIVAIALAASYLSSSIKNDVTISVYSCAIVLGIILMFVSIWRRWQIARETIFGN